MNNLNNKIRDKDLVTIMRQNGKDSIFRVNVSKNPDDEKYIGLFSGASVYDRYGRKGVICKIRDANPYKGLDDLVPKLAVDHLTKPRKWKAYDPHF